jgi:subtilisin family serine protease
MKLLVPFAVAVAAAMVLWGSAAGASPGRAVGPLAKGISLSHHQIPLSKAGSAKPRGLDGVPAKGNYAFLLKLGTASTGRVYESALPRGVRAARTAAKDQLATVRTAQSRVIAGLPMATHVLYKTHAALAAVAVYTNVANLPALQRISGVAHVYPIAPKKPSNSYAVHLVKAPEVWDTYGDTGDGSSIAIIDTGVDYTHADFGGPGTTAAYNAALATDDQDPTYPDTNKISTQSYDFAGDAYNADPTDPNYDPVPAPDNNPLDCNSHGTHTAGTAAGYGENPDGTTYTGDYTTLGGMSSSDYQALFRIGPGMAPLAKIYSYKVFGCAGSTDLVGAAIDQATDPNSDGDTADHVDVISMSLGADFASPQDGDSVESNAASALGVSVVAAAGNAGDVFDIGGSPGNAQSVIGVAASVDAYNQIDSLTVSAPLSIAGDYGAERSVAYDWANDPDLSGDLVALSDATNKDGCDPLNGTDAAAVNGKVAFLEWTDNDTNRRCGSVARSANVEAAGAIGAVFADDQEAFEAGITGSADIPVVMVTKSAGDAIRAQLGTGVTVSGTTANGFSLVLTQNDDKVAGFTSRGIREAGNVKPDVSGVGVSVFSAGMGTGNDGLNDSGTSMATPQVAGLDALIRNENPGWSPEEVKADIMNTADQDLFTGDNHTGDTFAPGRVGAGRIDAKAALDSQVLAYVTDDPGAVSASFGPLAVTGPTTLTKTIKVDNQSGSSETYDVSYDPITEVSGVDYSVSPDQVTVAAGDSATVTLTLTIADPTALTKTLDPTMDALQGGLPRDFVAEASGRVLFAPEDASPILRVPVYSSPRPASSMTQASSLDMPSGAIQTKALALTGTGVDQPAGDEPVQSLVAGFELQDVSPALPNCSNVIVTGCVHASDEKAADIKYVGTTSDAPQLVAASDDPLVDGEEYFAITTQGPWHTPASQNEYDIYIDSDGDGVADEIVFNTRLSATSDVFVSEVYDVNLGEVIDAWVINDRFADTDTAVFDSDTLVMPVFIEDLPGISDTHSRIHYGIVSFGSFSGDPVDFAGFDPNTGDLTLSADVLNPGVSVTGSVDAGNSPILYQDMPGTSLTVRRDAAAYAADHGMGAMMVHFHNTVGNKAQIVDLDHHTLTVTKGGARSGTVTSSPAGINCGTTCTHSFTSGTLVTLTATPASGSAFAGWSGGGCSGTGTCVVTMNAATTVTANFGVPPVNHTLSVTAAGPGSGSVTSSPAVINCGVASSPVCAASFPAGTSVTLTPHPASGSTFAGWSGACTGSGGCTVTMSSDLTVTATFAKKADTTRPRITTLKVKVNHHRRTAKVTFKGTDPGHGSTGLRYRCKLDKGKFKRCRSGKVYKHLRHGKHKVQVKAIDRAGNVSKPATKKFKV